MSKEKKEVVKHTPQDFVEAYNTLVEEYGYSIVAVPQLKQDPSTGIVGFVATLQVQEIDKEESSKYNK